MWSPKKVFLEIQNQKLKSAMQESDEEQRNNQDIGNLKCKDSETEKEFNIF